jgi:hypothetical protein
VAWVAGVVAMNPPEVEGESNQDHRHRDEVELRRSELVAGERGEWLVVEGRDHVRERYYYTK